MNKSSVLKSTLTLSLLLACSAGVQAAQSDGKLAADGGAAAGLDVTMTVMPDSPSLPSAVAGVISLPEKAADQARAHVRGAASTATAATAGIGTNNQVGSAGAHESAQGSLDVGGDLGVAGGAFGLDAGAAADIKAGADLGADVSHDSRDLGTQLGGGIGGDLNTGLKLH